MRRILLVFGLLALVPQYESSKSIKYTERALLKTLLERYEEKGTLGRPINKTHPKIEVQFGLQLIQVLELNANQQTLRTKWKDPLLTWDPNEYNNIDNIRMDSSLIWTPDLTVLNFADERMNEKKTVRMILLQDGSVEWVPQALLKTRCKIDIYFFPFDHQLCSISIGSAAYDQEELVLSWHEKFQNRIDFSDYVISMEWYTDGDRFHEDREIRKMKNISEPEIVPIPENCCQLSDLESKTRILEFSEDNKKIYRNYSIMNFHLKLERSRTLFVFSLIMPSGLLTALTMVVFWLPPESPAKMMLGMNIFIAFMVLLQLLARSIPSAMALFPMVGKYFAFNMLLITLSTLLVTLTINLYLRGDRNGKLPRGLRRIIVEGIGRLLLVRQYIPLPDESRLNLVSGKLMKKSTELELRESSKFSYSEDEFDTIDNTKNPVSQLPKPIMLEATSPTSTGDLESEDSPVMLSNTSNLERDVKELKRFIMSFVNKQKNTKRINLISMEWRTMALVLDRLFFVIYMFVIVIALLWALQEYSKYPKPGTKKVP